MTNKEILEKAIQKAIDGGYNLDKFFVQDASRIICSYSDLHICLCYEQIIYQHSFAKALWGETTEYEIPSVAEGKHNWVKVAWQYHLQQMVISEDPIQYLGENI